MHGHYQDLASQQQQHLARVGNAPGAQAANSYVGRVVYGNSSPMGAQGSYNPTFSVPGMTAANANTAGIPQYLFSQPYPSLNQQFSTAAAGAGVSGQAAYLMYPISGMSPQAVAAVANNGSGGTGNSAGGGSGGSVNAATGYGGASDTHNLQGATLQQQSFPSYTLVSPQGMGTTMVSSSSSATNHAGNPSASASAMLAPSSISSGNASLDALAQQQYIAAMHQRALRQQQPQYLAQQQQFPYILPHAAGKAMPVMATSQGSSRQGQGITEIHQKKPHDAVLEIRGEYGLDVLFNGLNDGSQAWPAASPGAEITNFSAIASGRLKPKINLLPAPTTESIVAFLTYGVEPEKVGVQFSDSEPLYPTISGLPYDEVDRRIVIDAPIPESYRKVKPQVLSIKLYQSFSDMNLFYIFYSMPGDLLHIAAARCLYDRGWTWEKKQKVWYREVKGSRASSPPAPSSSSPNSPRRDQPDVSPRWEVFDTRSWSAQKRADKQFSPEDVVPFEVVKDRMAKAAVKGKVRPPASSTATPSQATASSAGAPHKVPFNASSSSAAPSAGRGNGVTPSYFAGGNVRMGDEGHSS